MGFLWHWLIEVYVEFSAISWNDSSSNSSDLDPLIIEQPDKDIVSKAPK